MTTAPVFELLLCLNRAVAIAHTGTTAETTKIKKTIPANMMGLHGRLEWELYYSYPNSADDKILRVKFGATTFLTRTTTTSVSNRLSGFIANRGAVNSQVGSSALNSGGWGSATDAVVTAAVNTAANASFTVTCQLETAGETITIQAYSIKVFR